MRILRFSLLLTLPMALCLSSCTGDNSENILTEMDEVTPQESFVTYRGAASATTEGIGIVCVTDDQTTETVIAGDGEEIPAFVLKRTPSPFGGDALDVITLLIEDVTTSENGDTTFLRTDYAYCAGCLTSFENDGSNMEGDFTGEFFQTDEAGTDSPYGEISGSFNVLIETVAGFCQ